MSAKNGSALSVRTRGRLICLTITAVLGVGAVFSSSALASKSVPVTHSVLTLGDSLTFGYSAQLFNENFPTESPTAFENGFAQDYVTKHHKKPASWALVNLGCPGETSNSLIGNGPVGDALGETSEAPCAYHEVTGFPLHVSYGPAGTSQLESALYQLGVAEASGRPVQTVTLDIGANDELHAIAKAEALAREAAEKAGNEAGYAKAAALTAEAHKGEGTIYAEGVAAGEAKAGELEAEAHKGEGTIYAEGVAAGEAKAGVLLTEIAKKEGTIYAEGYAIGEAAFYAALGEGKDYEEALAIGEAAGYAAGYAKVDAAATAETEAVIGAKIYAAAAAQTEATIKGKIELAAYLTGKAAAEKYGAEHGLAEVKAWLESHALELFTHIVTNNAKIIGTLRANGYAGKVIVVGGYDPYGNVSGAGEVLAGSTALTKTLNQLEEAQLSKAPYSACFANPYKTFNTEKATEPARLQAYTNMANANVSNGKADGPDIHPTPLGYEVMAKIIRKDCGE